MPRVRTIQHSANSGEWSPRLEGRTDLQKYASALKTCENFIALKYGGVTRRPGTRYVNAVKDSAKTTILIPFQFSTDQAYIVEAGDTYMRFYKNGARIESPPATPVEISTPYAQGNLYSLYYAQSADVVYIAHRSYRPYKLSRTSDIAWTLTAIDFLDGPYLDENTTATTIKVSANTGTGLTMTASAALFAAGHIGSIWRIKGGTVWGYVRVTAFTSSTIVTVTVVSALDFAVPGTTTVTTWREGSWSGVRGWPSVVTLFQQRLWFGGTSEQPDTFWGSVTADYENFAEGSAQPADAVEFTLASNAVNAIRWMVPSRALLVGTAGQEWNVAASSGGAIEPADANAKAETTYGSAAVIPVQLHNAALFLQRSSKKLREMSYDQASDAYVAPDLTLLAEHITKTYPIIQMAYQQETESIVWAIRSDGQLLGLTYERTQDVVAWHRHISGGAFGYGDAQFRSVAVIPHPDGDRDQVWTIVKRTVNGSTVQFIEYLEDKNGIVATPFGEALGNMNVDAGVLQTHGGGTATITGLSHLEGQTVDIVGIPYAASGQSDVQPAVYPQKVVASGQVTGIDPPVYKSEVGLHYESTLVTMRPEIQTGQGTAQTARKRFSEVWVRLNESLGGEINGEQLSFRQPSDPMTSGPALITQDVRAKNLGWDRDGRISVKQKQPLPMTVLAIIGTLSVED